MYLYTLYLIQFVRSRIWRARSRVGDKRREGGGREVGRGGGERAVPNEADDIQEKKKKNQNQKPRFHPSPSPSSFPRVVHRSGTPMNDPRQEYRSVRTRSVGWVIRLPQQPSPPSPTQQRLVVAGDNSGSTRGARLAAHPRADLLGVAVSVVKIVV
ncbi:hypothetical protein B0H19DRAFT_1077673 [Mycena capillaripes]|nr:hypothetical protein B0H19DRAFT_1077673 [Mycena capillaripes]